MELQHEVEETIKRIRVALQHEVEETIDRLNNATSEINAEMHAMLAELARLRAIESAVDTEHDPATFLN
jgi:vacuolar-type H+-ATPase subunit D/Vma8